jgi:DHA1 family bicyclomycin/chloramphenicol resistance-like MFS transporter
MPPNRVVLFLALLLGLQPVTTDLYLPALPGLTHELGASMAQAQLTLTALLLAFGLSQLVWGPLSDRFGRKPILLVGMSAYVVASIGCALSPTMELLILWRTFQGAAMGAAVMCARALVRDLYLPAQGAHVMSKGLTGLGAIACITAPLGGLLTAALSWHAAMQALSVFGAITLLLLVLRFEETLGHLNVHALEPQRLVRTWRDIVVHPTFLTFSALSVSTYGGLFTFLAASSFVFIRVLGLSTTQYGFVMMSMSTLYIAGTFLCRYLLARIGLRKAVALGGAISLAGGTLMGAMALMGVQSLWAIVLPQALYMVGHGIHHPCSQSAAIGPFPQAAGAASALNGFFMMLATFVMGHWLGTHMDGTVLPLAQGVWFWSAALALTAWTGVQRHGRS